MDEKGRAAQVDTLWDRALAGSIGNTWHWLTFNFTRGTEGSRYFTPLTLNALAQVDEEMPGYAESMLARLEQINGREKNMQDYNAILQWLAELLVIHHLVQHPWPSSFSFQMEPTATGSKKNPEMVVTLDGVGALGVEVKCPNLDSHRRARSTNPWQLNARGVMRPSELNGGVTLPRDNPMKDFLISSDAKFARFRAQNADFASVLFVVWDDFINEPFVGTAGSELWVAHARELPSGRRRSTSAIPQRRRRRRDKAPTPVHRGHGQPSASRWTSSLPRLRRAQRLPTPCPGAQPRRQGASTRVGRCPRCLGHPGPSNGRG
jgi:hypothetical protein